MKLFPGVRVNLGLGGASLSVGTRGARMNFSKRGVRSTLGIPGTGLSYISSSSWSSGNRTAASSGGDGISFVSRSAAAEHRRALVEDERDRYQRQVFAEHVKQERAPIVVPLLVWIPFGLVAFVAVVGGGEYAVASGLLLVPIAVHVTLRMKLTKRIAIRVAQQMAATWPAHYAQAVARHADALRGREAATAAERAQWDSAEHTRVAWVTRLLNGELEAMNDAIPDTLSDLDFPFETQCRTAVIDQQRAVVLVDLPEIEDVVPETRTQALKNGGIKQAKRTKTERNGLYTDNAVAATRTASHPAACTRT